MNKRILSTIGALLFAGSMLAQTPKVIKEEKLDKKDHDKTMYMITFKDGRKGKICVSPSNEYYVHMALTSDRGPFTKQEAIQKLYDIDKKGSEGMQKLGANIAAGTSAGHTYQYDKKGRKYYEANGKRIYVK